jgi:hypothetical protein
MLSMAGGDSVAAESVGSSMMGNCGVVVREVFALH